MKKRTSSQFICLILLFAVCFFCFAGCGENNDSMSPFSQDGEKSAQKDDISATQAAQKEEGGTFQEEYPPLPEYDCSGTYYKVEVTPAAYDTDALQEFLLPEFDESQVRINEAEASRPYYIEVDGVRHTWEWSSGYWNSFSYRNNSWCRAECTEEEALALSGSFVEAMGFPVAANPEVFMSGEDGEYKITYSLLYEGVPALGNESYYLGEGYLEDGFAYGEYVYVSVGGNGIDNVCLNHFYEPVEVLEEYRGEEDFLSREELAEILKTIDGSYYNFGGKVKYHSNTEKISMMYIPGEEVGKLVLRPGFYVEGGEVSAGDEFIPMRPRLIDAVTGYVYRDD